MRNHILALLLALMAVGMTGCGDSNNFAQISGQQGYPVGPGPGPSPTPSTQAHLRIATLPLAFGDLDVLVDGTEVQSDASTGEVTNYFDVTAGQLRIQVRAAGSETDLLSQNVTVTADTYNTVVVSGIGQSLPSQAALGQTIDGLRLLTLVDDVTPNANGISVRFVNAIPFEEGNEATIETPVGDRIVGPQDYNTASTYVDFTEALDFDWVNLVLPVAEEVWAYETEEGTNKPIFDAIRDALGGRPGNLTIFIVGDGGEIPAFVVIDKASAGGETYVFQGAKQETL